MQPPDVTRFTLRGRDPAHNRPMTRAELIEALARKHAELDPGDVKLAVAVILDGLSGSLADGRRIELRGFGSFNVTRRSARVARNPKTGSNFTIPERLRPRFKPGRPLFERVQDSEAE